ncbi:MAG TPA: peptidoglycan DD-metalloendopeptidase family protein [Candidatus Binataceae bacterium]|nr:peptidoglycan DD-metalloendopeptidase family protein [Candidatus Binataceae bacterium]
MATAAAIHLFMTPVPNGAETSPVPAGSAQVDAFNESPEVVEPAPPAIAIETDLEHTANIEGYLVQAGLDEQSAHAWATDFQRAAQTNLLRKGHPVTVYKDSETGNVTGFKYDVDDRVQVYESTIGAGIIKAYKQPIKYTVRPVSLAFEIRGNSLHDTAVKHHLPQSIVESLEDAFSSRYDVNQMAAGTAVKLIYDEHVSHDGVHILPGDIEAAEIRHGTQTTKAYAFRDEHGRAHLYDEEGRALGPQYLRFPVSFQYISSPFTLHRYHPILHQYRPHLGVDLAALYGTPVKAIADGRVESSGWCGELGNCIRLEHDNNTVSIYGHLSKIDANARPGAYIKIGQVIGNVGSTGLSTGPHLHFAIEKRGLNVDPLSQTLGVHHQVSPRMKAVFDNLKTRYQAALAKLPNLGSHFAPALSRKPAISTLADQYHVTLKPHLRVKASGARHRSGALVSDIGFTYKASASN